MATFSSRWCEQLDSVQGLSKDELSLQLNQLAKQKHMLDAELLLYLSEVDRRGMYREQALSSLFEFCMCRLGCSADVAYKRVGVARMLRRFPLVFDLLAEGRIHMSALMLLRPHLTEENHLDWLSAAAGKSKRQVEILVARRCPRPDVPAQVRKLPEPRPNAITAIIASADTTEPKGTVKHSAAPADTTEPKGTVKHSAAPVDTTEPRGAVKHSAAPTTRIQPLSGTSYRVVFTAREALKQKIDRAIELLSHAVSPSDLPALIERAIDLLIEHEERRRFATGSRRKTSAKQQLCQNCQTNFDGSQDPGRVDELVLSRASVPRETAPCDAEPRETAPCDAEPRDAAPCEGVPRETALCDAVPRETAPCDAEPRDAAPCDAEPRETAPCDAEPRDAAPCEGVPRETALCDAVPRETAPCDAEPRDAAPCDAEPRDAAPHDADKLRRDAAPSNDANPQDGFGARKGSPPKLSRYVPAAVRRAVWRRDGGQCTFVDSDGNRCEERRFLEMDHRFPYALGGASTIENCRLLCRCHNSLSAELVFGRRRIEEAAELARIGMSQRRGR